MSRLLPSFALAIGAVVLCDACMHRSAAQPAATSTPAAKSKDRVLAAPPARKTLKLYTSQPGRIEAFEETPIHPKVTGYVDEVRVDIGDEVKKGATLIKVSVPELHDELAQKEALVGLAEAEIRQAESAVTAAQASAASANARVREAVAGVSRAEAELERSHAEYERIKELVADGSVTRKLADESLSQVRAAEAGHQEAKAKVESAQAVREEATAGILKAEADRAAAVAGWQVAKANLAQTATLLSYTTIKAPFDGVITMRDVDTGHFVQTAATGKPLLVVSRTDKVRVFVDVPENEAVLVTGGEGGDDATIQVQAVPGHVLEAKVTRTAWSLNAANRSLRTEIDLPNSEGKLRPGMFANVSILLEHRHDVLVLPATAIQYDGGNAYCFRVEDGKLNRSRVELGLRSGGEVEVLSGLGPEQRVVSTRVESLKHDQPVELIAPANP